MLDEALRSVNLRDIGGVATNAGDIVRRGRAFRSAALSALDGPSLAAIRALGIRTVIDLRHNREREAHPTPWEMLGCADYRCRDHWDSGADLARRLSDPALTAADSRRAMIDLYRALPYAQAESYGWLFRALAAGEGPVLFHCAVGKDRTGAAAALVLAALGVPHDAIVTDYLATSAFDLPNSAHLRGRAPVTAERAAIFAPLLTVDADYLAAMFEAVTARSGSLETYLAETLGLGDADLAALRTRMLDRG